MGNPEVANSRAIAKHARYGGQLGSYRIYKRGIVANELEPTDERQAAVVGDRFEQCRWAIQMPPGVTGYDVHFLRWVSVLDPLGNEIVPGWFIEEQVVSATDHLIADQYVNGDKLAVYIDNIAGVVGTGFIVLRKGINKHS